MLVEDANNSIVPSLDEAEIHKHERHRLRSAVFVGLALASLVVLFAAFWHDSVPDEHHLGSEAFIWWRLIFTFLSVGLIGFAIERETEHRRLIKRMLSEHDRVRAADQNRSDVVASITHELKTPLTSLLGYATILRKRADALTPQQRDEYIGVVESQGQRILHLIEELLQSSRLDAEMGKLQRAPMDLGKLARDVSNEMGFARGRTVEVDVPEQDLGLFGDRSALEHVITNLIDNAFKYSDGVVQVRITEEEREVHLSVKDSGVGIPAEELDGIFERFQQTSNSHGQSSVGLGLYIVRNLVHAHGGRVWAESKPGEGTNLIVALPRRAPR